MGLDKINSIKKAKGMTSAQLSKKSGVPLGTLNKILNGETKNPSYEVVSALAQALDCSVDTFDDRSNANLKNTSNENLAEAILILESLNPDLQEYALKQIRALLELQGKKAP